MQICRDFDILVVDNGSTDGSVEWLKEQEIPTIFLPENTGFSGAVNVGLKAAATPYVILLNNDTEPDFHYVGEMIKAIERSPKIFSVSCKMIQLCRKELMDDAGDMYSLLGWAAIYRREVFDEIGYFDEMHFAYLEDLDVGYRARIAGYDNIYCPTAMVYHVGSGTSGSKYNPFKVKLAARNNIYLNYKNMPLLQLAVNLLPILLGMGLKYMFFKKKGFGRDYAAGVREGLATAKRCRKVPYSRERLKNYLAIEWELITGTFIYVYEFAARQIAKL